MYKIIYTIPVAGSSTLSVIATERTRVGNIFNTGRQKVILNRNTDAGASTMDVKWGIDTFTKLDDALFSSLTIVTDRDNPLLINGLPIHYENKLTIDEGNHLSIFNNQLISDEDNEKAKYSLLARVFDEGNQLSRY